ncbi:hypothetical protein [Actinoplanes flavus]|uniref:Uncharacterized protein n=1 Tax=Actinoplanes flavus TaxID=2820290 RepID=A0ABS3UD09_9ACTN|nr:hypothetical protein [Actinoplanes flavus]MBO3736665.1 hypothetical protein [Actinoplanes flavus]
MIGLLRRRPAASTTTIADVVRLRAQLAAATAESERHRQLADERLRLHQADIACIGERLRSEAGNRGWCHDFEDIVDALNEQLTVELTHRGWPYLVDTTLTVDLTVAASSDLPARKAAIVIIRQAEDQLRQLNGVHVYYTHPEDLTVTVNGRSATVHAHVQLRIDLDATNERHARVEAAPVIAVAVATLTQFPEATATSPDASTFDISPR